MIIIKDPEILKLQDRMNELYRRLEHLKEEKESLLSDNTENQNQTRIHDLEKEIERLTPEYEEVSREYRIALVNMPYDPPPPGCLY